MCRYIERERERPAARSERAGDGVAPHTARLTLPTVTTESGPEPKNLTDPTFVAYTHEVHAYEHARRALAAGEAPSLLASDPSLRAILTSPLPGRVVRGLPLETQDERRVHELAGSLLRRWHNSTDPPSDQVRETVRTSVAEQAHEAAGYLDTIAVHLTSDEHRLIQRVSANTGPGRRAPPGVPTRRLLAPQLAVGCRPRRHGLIDFEEASDGHRRRGSGVAARRHLAPPAPTSNTSSFPATGVRSRGQSSELSI